MAWASACGFSFEAAKTPQAEAHATETLALLEYRHLFFATQIAAAARSHFGGMHAAGGNITAFAGSKGARCAGMGQRHFSIENHVGCFSGVRVIRVSSVRSILPDVRTQEPFFVKLVFQ